MTSSSHAARRLFGLAFGAVPAEERARWTVADWRAIVAEAERREVEALLFTRARDGAFELGDEAGAELELLYCRAALRAQLVTRQLAELLGALDLARVPVILLKGAALAHTVYEDPALRRMSDLDLLVPARHGARAAEVLVALGYGTAAHAHLAGFFGTHHHDVPLVRAGGLPVELHRALVPAGAGVRIDEDDLWSRSLPIVVGGAPARILARVDQLIHLGLHAGRGHGWGTTKPYGLPLRAVLDWRKCVEAFEASDWAALAPRAAQVGAGRFVYCLLRLVRDVAPASVPGAVLAKLAHGPMDDEAVAVIREALVAPAGEDSAFLVRVARNRALLGALRALHRWGIDPATPRVGGADALRAELARWGWSFVDRLVPGEATRLAVARARRRVAIEQWLAAESATAGEHAPRSVWPS